METGDSFYYFGADGAYQAQSSHAQSQNMANQTIQTAAHSLGASIGGLGVSMLNQCVTSTDTSNLAAYFKHVSMPATIEAKKKVKGFLTNLRSEIDGWHGDILDRCPA